MNSEFTPTIRNDFLKLFYAATLIEFPAEKIREFWGDHILHLNGRDLSSAELFEFLWHENNRVPLHYLFGVIRDIEPFVNARGVAIAPFMDRMIKELNKNSLVVPRMALKIIAPFAELLFTAIDIRQLCVQQLFPNLARKLFTGFRARVVSHKHEGGWIQSIIMLRSHDEKQPYPLYDVEIFTARLFQVAPLGLGLPEYEEVSVISEARVPGQIVPGGVMKGKQFFIGDENYGREVCLDSFCRAVGIDPVRHRIPCVNVVEITRDYYCPERKRIVLRTGCVYGAPLALLSFRYRGGKDCERKEILSSIIENALDEGVPFWKMAEARHHEMLEFFSGKTIFDYEHTGERLSINGRIIARNASAKIIRKLLVIHQTSGRTEFEQRELLRDPAIVNDPSNPNLALRLRRVIDLAGSRIPKIKVTKTGRGTFSFQVEGPFELNELT